MGSTLSNIGYNSIAKVLTMAVGVLTTTVLQRNLGPEDYGVVGVAMIVIGFLGRFSDMGMGSALVQTPDINAPVLETAQALNMVLSLVLFLCAVIAVPFSGMIFKNPAVPAVVFALSFSFLISAIGFLPSSLLAREMRFGALRMPSVAGSLVRALVAMSCVFAGLKYWSLVAGTLAATLTTSLLLNIVHPVKARWRIDRDVANGLMKFGLPLVASGILVFMVFNADNFIIGSFMGTSQLGYYTVAFTWSTYVANTLYEIVHSVLFSRFSQVQNDRASLAAMYYRSLQVVVFGAVLVNASLFAVADGFLVTMLGKGSLRWLPSLPVLQILCVYGVLRASMEPVGNVILALGRTKLLLWANFLCITVELGLLPFVVVRWGLTGVACLVSLAYGLQWVVYGPFLKRELGIGLGKLMKLAIPVSLAAVLGVLASRAVQLPNPLSWASIILRCSVVCAVFTLIHEVLTRGSMLKEFKLIVESRFRKVALLAVTSDESAVN